MIKRLQKCSRCDFPCEKLFSGPFFGSCENEMGFLGGWDFHLVINSPTLNYLRLGVKVDIYTYIYILIHVLNTKFPVPPQTSNEKAFQHPDPPKTFSFRTVLRNRLSVPLGRPKWHSRPAFRPVCILTHPKTLRKRPLLQSRFTPHFAAE